MLHLNIYTFGTLDNTKLNYDLMLLLLAAHATGRSSCKLLNLNIKFAILLLAWQ